MSFLNRLEPIESKYALLATANCLLVILVIFVFLLPAILIHNLTDWPGITQFVAEVVFFLIIMVCVDSVR